MAGLEPDDAASRSGVVRALAVIELLASRAPEMLGVSAVARDLDLPKAVAHRILKQLVAVGFLSFDEATKMYRLGAGALNVGLAALRALEVPKIARPHLEHLVRETAETATLSVRQGWTRVYVDQVLSPHEIRMSVQLGTVHELHAGASSKAILAALAPDELELFLSQHTLHQLTDATITSRDALRKELATARRRGYAVSSGERQAGAGSVAAAIHDASGVPFGSISICGPKDRLDQRVVRAYAPLVMRASNEISQQLGYRPSRTAAFR